MNNLNLKSFTIRNHTIKTLILRLCEYEAVCIWVLVAVLCSSSVYAQTTPLPTVTTSATQTEEGSSGVTSFTITTNYSTDVDLSISITSGTANFGTSCPGSTSTDHTGVDYILSTVPTTPPTTPAFTFTGGSESYTFNATNSSLQVSFTTCEDSVVEQGETITLTLSESNIQLTTATVTITDNDTAEADIAIVPATIEEGSTVTTTLTVTLTTPSSTDTVLPINLGGNATEGSASCSDPGQDYVTPSTIEITVSASNLSGQKAITIETCDDTVVELNETIRFTLSLSGFTNIQAGTTTDVTLSITDNDMATVSITPVTTAIAEGNGTNTANFRISMSNPAVFDVTVSLAFSGTAVKATSACSEDQADYTALSSATILAGSTNTLSTATICNDTIVERDDVLTLTLDSVASNPGFDQSDITIDPNTNTATVTITNDDTAEIRFFRASTNGAGMTIYTLTTAYDERESNPSPNVNLRDFTIGLVLTGTDTVTTASFDVSVTVATSEGSGTTAATTNTITNTCPTTPQENIDYLSYNQQLTISSGQERITDTITICVDDIVELNESFTLTLSNITLPTNASDIILNTNAYTATVTLENDDEAEVIFTQVDALGNVVIGTETEEETGIFRYRLDLKDSSNRTLFAPEGGLTIQIETSEITSTIDRAIAGENCTNNNVDFANLSTSIQISAGNSESAIQKITICNDSIFEFDETFQVNRVLSMTDYSVSLRRLSTTIIIISEEIANIVLDFNEEDPDLENLDTTIDLPEDVLVPTPNIDPLTGNPILVSRTSNVLFFIRLAQGTTFLDAPVSLTVELMLTGTAGLSSRANDCPDPSDHTQDYYIDTTPSNVSLSGTTLTVTLSAGMSEVQVAGQTCSDTVSDPNEIALIGFSRVSRNNGSVTIPTTVISHGTALTITFLDDADNTSLDFLEDGPIQVTETDTNTTLTVPLFLSNIPVNSTITPIFTVTLSDPASGIAATRGDPMSCTGFDYTAPAPAAAPLPFSYTTLNSVTTVSVSSTNITTFTNTLNFDISLCGDNLVEAQESFTITIAGRLPGLLIQGETEKTINILDDDDITLILTSIELDTTPSGTITDSITLDENSSSSSLSVTATSSSTIASNTVLTLQVSSGASLSGIAAVSGTSCTTNEVDYVLSSSSVTSSAPTAISGTFTFTFTFDIEICDDSLPETTESFDLTIAPEPLVQPTFTLNTPNLSATKTLNITDNDIRTDVSLGEDLTTTEPEDNNTTFTVPLTTTASATPTSPLRIQVEVRDIAGAVANFGGSCMGDTDYAYAPAVSQANYSTSITERILTVHITSDASTVLESAVTILICSDTHIEQQERFEIRLVGVADSQTITIEDSDAAEVVIIISNEIGSSQPTGIAQVAEDTTPIIAELRLQDALTNNPITLDYDITITLATETGVLDCTTETTSILIARDRSSSGEMDVLTCTDDTIVENTEVFLLAMTKIEIGAASPNIATNDIYITSAPSARAGANGQTNPGPNGVTNPSAHIEPLVSKRIEILDNERPYIAFEKQSYVFYEDTGSNNPQGTLKLELRDESTNELLTTAQELTFSFRLSLPENLVGTVSYQECSLSGSDVFYRELYNDVTITPQAMPEDITIAHNDLTNSEVPIEICSDDEAEALESFRLSMVNTITTDNFRSARISPAQIVIIDDDSVAPDATSLQFLPVHASPNNPLIIGEGQNTTFQIHSTRLLTTTQSIRFRLALVSVDPERNAIYGETCTGNTDFTLTNQEGVAIPFSSDMSEIFTIGAPGSNQPSDIAFRIEACIDFTTPPETLETRALQIINAQLITTATDGSNPTMVDIIDNPPKTQHISIRDESNPVIISFIQEVYSVNESAGTLSVRLQLSRPYFQSIGIQLQAFSQLQNGGQPQIGQARGNPSPCGGAFQDYISYTNDSINLNYRLNPGSPLFIPTGQTQSAAINFEICSDDRSESWDIPNTSFQNFYEEFTLLLAQITVSGVTYLYTESTNHYASGLEELSELGIIVSSPTAQVRILDDDVPAGKDVNLQLSYSLSVAEATETGERIDRLRIEEAQTLQVRVSITSTETFQPPLSVDDYRSGYFTYEIQGSGINSFCPEGATGSSCPDDAVRPDDPIQNGDYEINTLVDASNVINGYSFTRPDGSVVSSFTFDIPILSDNLVEGTEVGYFLLELHGIPASFTVTQAPEISILDQDIVEIIITNEGQFRTLSEELSSTATLSVDIINQENNASLGTEDIIEQLRLVMEIRGDALVQTSPSCQTAPQGTDVILTEPGYLSQRRILPTMREGNFELIFPLQKTRTRTNHHHSY